MINLVPSRKHTYAKYCYFSIIVLTAIFVYQKSEKLNALKKDEKKDESAFDFNASFSDNDESTLTF